MAKKKLPALPLPEKLLLFRFLLREFGFATFEEMQQKFADQRLSATEAAPSLLIQNVLALVNRRVPVDLLRQFDDNLTQHLGSINAQRLRPISLTYFQYFGLLFAEYYLHHYFLDADDLLTRLNNFRHGYCVEHPRVSEVTPYTLDDLNKLAYWSATGSGKTLLLNINLLQYAHYCPPAELRNQLVLTPDEKLSDQHLESLQESGFTGAAHYLASPNGPHVKVIDLHKLYDRSRSEKKAPVDIAAFEDKNALFVDEGHLGSTQEESTWRRYRQKLAQGGFTFEYSATFGQLQQTEVQNEYAKCILFDYSYRHFHRDGYGKDYRIDNIENRQNTLEATYPYLLTNLLLFVQQQRYYQTNRAALELYRFEAPLLLFVGHTVNTAQADALDDDTLSDVQKVLAFLSYLLSEPNACQQRLSAISAGTDDYATAYHAQLSWLLAQPEAESPEKLYKLVLNCLFHTDIPGQLELNVLSQASGEIGLKVSGNNPYFGLIYIGDVSRFKSGLGDTFAIDSDRLSPSLFERLDTPAAQPINMLIGARRFIVGWNSFRVTGISLINFGRGEGTQIIQLFGRGVRLRGRDESLKRSKSGEGIDNSQKLLETLNVFGLDARYIKRFRDELAKAGVGSQHRTVPVPIVPYTTATGAALDTLGLLTLQRNANAPAYPTTAPIRLVPNTQSGMFIKLDLATRHYHALNEQEQQQMLGQVADLPRYHALLDYSLLYRRWNQYRQRKGYHNLVLDIDELPALLDGIGYEVTLDTAYQPRTAADLNRLQQLVEMVLHRYTDRFYARQQRVYEGQHLQSVILTATHPAVSGWEYSVELAETNEQGDALPEFAQLLDKVEVALTDASYPTNLPSTGNGLRAAQFDTHLYHPLLLDVTDQPVGVSAVRPVGINVDEHVFVSHLRRYLHVSASKHPDCSFFLLRNPASRDRGVSFYFSAAGGFYPDFMLWIKQGDKQHLAFIDPHGLRNEQAQFKAEKIQLHQRIQEVETALANPSLHLHSFVLSPNSFAKAGITAWIVPEGISFDDYAASQHVYALPVGGATAAAPYLEKMIEQILEI
jgi:hypothetical protein